MMERETLLVSGPGGVGKSPLNGLVRPEVARVESYRLRPGGPRDRDDHFYAHPDLGDQVRLLHRKFGLAGRRLGETVTWYPDTGTFLTRVRGEEQVLFLGSLEGRRLIKAELYAPLVPVLLGEPGIRALFGRLWIVVLNPAGPLSGPLAPGEIRRRTAENCRLRGDSEDSVFRRAASVEEEVSAWRELLGMGALEFPEWPFPEHLYASGDREDLLARAGKLLVSRCPPLARFFRPFPDGPRPRAVGGER